MKWTNILLLVVELPFPSRLFRCLPCQSETSKLSQPLCFLCSKKYWIAQYLAFSSVGVTIDGQSLCFNCIIITLLNGVDHQVLENF